MSNKLKNFKETVNQNQRFGGQIIIIASLLDINIALYVNLDLDLEAQ